MNRFIVDDFAFDDIVYECLKVVVKNQSWFDESEGFYSLDSVVGSIMMEPDDFASHLVLYILETNQHYESNRDIPYEIEEWWSKFQKTKGGRYYG